MVKPSSRIARMQLEVPQSRLHVAADLRLECFAVGKLDFIANALEEGDLNLRMGGEVDGMEVQQVGLDGKAVVAEVGRTPTLVTESKVSSATRVRVM